ncbi:uncharacterized protein LOC116213940 [Punica granatum]|uniref:Uncharacterized protein LOC116213940 n=2 Tax=Punica granatum TaxID=22663 RepID=A0A6P8EEK6_PUNGR|nr:uncharacterized protein LOC116213940 [Punica granatum]
MKPSIIRTDFRLPFPTGRSDHSGLIRSDAGPPSVSVRGGATSPAPPPPKLRAVKTAEKPPICTADEIHYVPVSNSDWKLALWRYTPPPDAPRRNRPLLLLSGVGTNAVGYDLDPESSFARHMSGQGFDTWVVEFRGAGLSAERVYSEEAVRALSESGTSSSGENGAKALYQDKRQCPPQLTEFRANFFEQFKSFIGGGQYSSLVSLLRGLSKRILNLMERQSSVPPPFIDLQERISSSLEDFEKQLDVIVKYDWDFDHYLEEDVPAVMEYVRTHCKSKDHKLLAVGHSMGGILLYAMLSRCASEGKDTGLASVATLGSSLDYTSSRSSLKTLLPLADPAQALNVPVIPIGALIAAAHPFVSRPPYFLSCLNAQITAQDMIPELLEKLVMKNFGTVPAKLLLQLTSAFREGGLCDRSGTFFYKDYIGKTNVPVLAVAGDQDLICPPEAVYETAKLIPEHLLTFKVFGEPGGPHYAHYDLVGGLMAADQVYPCIIDFLCRHDMV